MLAVATYIGKRKKQPFFFVFFFFFLSSYSYSYFLLCVLLLLLFLLCVSAWGLARLQPMGRSRRSISLEGEVDGLSQHDIRSRRSTLKSTFPLTYQLEVKVLRQAKSKSTSSSRSRRSVSLPGRCATAICERDICFSLACRATSARRPASFSVFFIR